MIGTTTLVVASSNRGKIAEYRALLRDLPVDIVSLGDVVRERLTIVEDGATFEANAVKKAAIVADAVMMLTLADDSGLEVDALGGRPGVRSARFAAPGATDAENNAALLAALEEVELAQRTARFRCVVALVDPWGPPGTGPTVGEGACAGSIAREPRGTAGFGYDPLFVVDGMQRTLAELSAGEKNAVSHRARAIAAIRPKLEAVLQNRLTDVDRISVG